MRTAHEESEGLRGEVQTLDKDVRVARASAASLETQLTTSQVCTGRTWVRIPTGS